MVAKRPLFSSNKQLFYSPFTSVWVSKTIIYWKRTNPTQTKLQRGERGQVHVPVAHYTQG